VADAGRTTTIISAGCRRATGDPVPAEARIGLEHEDGVTVLLIDHPPRNLLTRSMVRDLAARIRVLEEDDAVRALVVSGAGGTHFCGGLDMAEWSALSARGAQEEISRGQDTLLALERITKPTIASVVGMCRGAGAELALACDIRIASETAVFSHPEVDVGWMPSHGGTARLARIVGRSHAFEILVSGKTLKGLDALRLGIVNHLTPPDQALGLAKDLARIFASKPRAAVRAIKRTLVEGDEKPYRNRFLLESQHAVQLLGGEEYKAALSRARETK